jgi:hypothetical protein
MHEQHTFGFMKKHMRMTSMSAEFGDEYAYRCLMVRVAGSLRPNEPLVMVELLD